MKPIPPHKIVPYQPQFKEDVEKFRDLSFEEGNDSLARDKFELEGFMGQIWVVFVDGKIVGTSAIEASHYTDDPRVAARVVRLHVLKEYRSTAFGIVIMEHQLEWCKRRGFKIMWWSIDINKRAHNAIYQKKRSPAYALREQHKDMWDGWWQDLVFARDRLFIVDPRADLLQYVYYFVLEDGYKWKPESNMVYIDHDGDIKQDQVRGLIDYGPGYILQRLRHPISS